MFNKIGTVNWLSAILNLASTSCLPVVLANITFDVNEKNDDIQEGRFAGPK
jgi:hypothetical protein